MLWLAGVLKPWERLFFFFFSGHVTSDHSQATHTTHPDTQIYSIYPPQNIPALNPIDLYSRQNYPQNYVSRENPQNLVVNRQFENVSPYQDVFKKLRREGDVAKDKVEEPKENLKPNDNKMLYNAEFANTEKEESNVSNKTTEELTLNIKGEYLCYKCNDICPSKRILKQHAKSCSGKDESADKVGKFGCSQCPYRCQSPAILKIHERTHSGEKPFSCNFCDYKSGQKNNVAKHILVHMKEKPFRCQFCDYRCAQKNNLVVHERTHTGYKPFACPYCEYRTVQKPNLVKHMYLHTDQKPFSCDMCSYRCVQKTNLTKHKQRHLNENGMGMKMLVPDKIKPYRPRQKSLKCTQCHYRCVQKSSMEKHMHFKHNTEFVNIESSSNSRDEESIQNLSVKKDFDDDTNLCEVSGRDIQS